MIPKHVAFIMDGNGRWAKMRNKPRAYGHRKGATALDALIEHAFDKGVGVLSFYAFSTENWSRPKEEVDKLLSLMMEMLATYLPRMKREGIRLIISGDLSRVSPIRRKKIEKAIEETKHFEGKILNICFNYGGRTEILRAVNNIIEDGKQDITEDVFESYLYTHDLPPVDLLIRTSGEMRISNFMLWQIAYSELYFTDVLWPDFSPNEFDKAVEWFNGRDRRFGGLK